MGAGFHGGFGNTKGAKKGKLFSRVNYKGSVKVDGIERDVSRRVYQRNDIDFNYVDPKSGVSNLEKMRAGRAPIGNDGKPIQLHHILQKEVGPLVEIREITHQEYSKILHGIGSNNDSFRNDTTLNRQFNNFRISYWKWRAAQYEKGSR